MIGDSAMWGFFVQHLQQKMDQKANTPVDGEARADNIWSSSTSSDRDGLLKHKSSKLLPIEERHNTADNGNAMNNTYNIDLFHAQLHQKVLELRSGKAFSNPKSWINKIHAQYMKINKFIQDFVTVVAFTAPLGIAFFVDLTSARAAWLLLVVPCWATLFLTFTLDHHKGGHETIITKKLTTALHQNPSLKDDIKVLVDHINHPDILSDWWREVEKILDAIISEHEEINHSNKPTLQQLLNQSDDYLVVVETNEQVDEQSKMWPADAPIAKHIKI